VGQYKKSKKCFRYALNLKDEDKQEVFSGLDRAALNVYLRIALLKLNKNDEMSEAFEKAFLMKDREGQFILRGQDREDKLLEINFSSSLFDKESERNQGF
jgi:hypothetical protein